MSPRVWFDGQEAGMDIPQRLQRSTDFTITSSTPTTSMVRAIKSALSAGTT
jgi:hypothetical protein